MCIVKCNTGFVVHKIHLRFYYCYHLRLSHNVCTLLRLIKVVQESSITPLPNLDVLENALYWVTSYINLDRQLCVLCNYFTLISFSFHTTYKCHDNGAYLFTVGKSCELLVWIWAVSLADTPNKKNRQKLKLPWGINKGFLCRNLQKSNQVCGQRNLNTGHKEGKLGFTLWFYNHNFSMIFGWLDGSLFTVHCQHIRYLLLHYIGWYL